MFTILAHAGEEHATAAEAASHSVLEAWYLALPLFIVGMGLLATAVYRLSGRSKGATLNVMLAALFICGVSTYKLSETISIASLTSGFALALSQVVVGLGRPGRKTHHRKK